MIVLESSFYCWVFIWSMHFFTRKNSKSSRRKIRCYKLP